MRGVPYRVQWRLGTDAATVVTTGFVPVKVVLVLGRWNRTDLAVQVVGG
jgi:hypothetical protein